MHHEFADDPLVREGSNVPATSIAPLGFGAYSARIPSYHGHTHDRVLLDPALNLTASTPRIPIDNHNIRHDIIPASVSASNYLADRPEAAEIHPETILLRHYRYNMAPWIDIGDPQSSFGINIMLGAKENRSLFQAILALAAWHRSVCLSKYSNDLEDALRYRKEAEDGLALEEVHIRRAGSILLMLGDLFSSYPPQWRSVLFNHLDSSGVLSSLAGLGEHLDEALFWLYFRIGKAVFSTYILHFIYRH